MEWLVRETEQIRPSFAAGLALLVVVGGMVLAPSVIPQALSVVTG